MSKVIFRQTCRVCGNKKLVKVLSLGKTMMSDFVDSSKEKRLKVPLELVVCKKCSLLQLRHTAPMDHLYQNQYWYKSGINPVIVRDLQQIAKITTKFMDLGEPILDLGANDGTLLSFVNKKFFRVGCEPAKNLWKELKKNCDVMIKGFWDAKKVGSCKFKVITAIGMFYDCEDPNQFVGDVAEVLADDGVFIAQLMTLRPMINNADVGNICHEHLEYYSYKSLVRLFEQNGLEIFCVQKNKINGGSYRIFACHYNKPSVKLKERNPSYKTFRKKIERNKKKTVEFIKKQIKKGKKIYGYGASTKANTILQYYGLTSKEIKGMADRNEKKHGKFMVGSGIPIVSEQEARKHADYFWIMPYGFLDYFLEREWKWREKGGKFIVSMPKFNII